MTELVFEVTQEADSGFVTEALGERIIKQADTWDELRENVPEVVNAFYFDRTAPQQVRLHLVRDEVFGVKLPRIFVVATWRGFCANAGASQGCVRELRREVVFADEQTN